jgi:hypothetical protein
LVEFSPIGFLKSPNLVIAFFGQFFSAKFESSSNFSGTLFHGKRYILVLTQNGLGHALEAFLSSASGHPVGNGFHHITAFFQSALHRWTHFLP